MMTGDAVLVVVAGRLNILCRAADAADMFCRSFQPSRHNGSGVPQLN